MTVTPGMFVLWAGQRFKVLEVENKSELAKIAKAEKSGEVDHTDYWWCRADVLKELPE